MSNVRIVSREEVSNELIYYNLDVINSSTVDQGSASDPVVKFEETRSTSILSDATKYNFSIIRFTINGANKDLPLFIPLMAKNQTSTTEYVVVNSSNNTFRIVGCATGSTGNQFYYNPVTIATGNYTPAQFLTALNTALSTSIGALFYNISGITASFLPNSYVLSFTITQNGSGAFVGLDFVGNSGSPLGAWGLMGMIGLPTPPPTAVPNYFTLLFSTSGSNPFTFSNIYNDTNTASPITLTPITSTNVLYDTIYSITLAGKFNGTLFTPITVPIKWYPETNDVIQPPLDASGKLVQNMSNKYWWCYTYKHWIDCVNRAFTDAFAALATQVGKTVYTIPPIMTYNASTGLFSISFDSNGFGDNTNTFLNSLTQLTNIQSPINTDERLAISGVAGGPGASFYTEDFALFFNSNMMGLFSNFNNIYFGLEGATYNGMDNLIIVSNEQTASYDPYTVSGGQVVKTSTTSDKSYPRILFVETQDYPSTSSLWSPIASIVFCSTLLPTLPENSGVPIALGAGNNTVLNTSLNAFTPIITDIALPMSSGSDYRQFISYTPSSEYRLTSLGTSPVDVRDINIQVYWKNRLTNELVPLTLFNQSSVSIKIMFRKRNGGK